MTKSNLHSFIVYIIFFFLSWSFYVFLIYPQIVLVWGGDSFLTAVFGIVVRLLLWILPILVYLKYVDKVKPIEYLKLNVFSKRALIFTIVAILVYAFIYFLQFGLLKLDQISITWSSFLGIILTVGLFEEIVFRGFILQKLNGYMNFWLANILTTILFILIHFPGWFGIGLNPSISIIIIISVGILGFLMGILFKTTKSLWPAIIVHQVNDIFSAVVWRI